MNTRELALALVAGMSALLSSQIVIGAALPRYHLQDIKPTSSTEDNYAEDLNNLGVGTGTMFSGSTGGDRALVLKNGTTQKLGTLPTTGALVFSDGYGINDLGDVVGESSFGGNDSSRAFLYSNGTMQNLGTLGGSTSSANAINNSRQVVGRSATGNGFSPFLWQNGNLINLGTLGGSDGSAVDINEAGNVVGFSNINANDLRAFYFRDLNGNGRSDSGEMINLGTLSGFTETFAEAVNDSGQVVGQLTDTIISRGFLWSDKNGNHRSDAGEMVQLPTLFNTYLSIPGDINSAGDIVGASVNLSGRGVPTIWTGGGVYDLTTFIDLLPGQTMPTLIGAVVINDVGQILVRGRVGSGRDRVYMMSPVSVPEPSAIGLAAMSLLGLAMLRRWRM